MQFALFAVTFLASLAAGREIAIFDDPNFEGRVHLVSSPNNGDCINLDGSGDLGSSVAGAHNGGDCTTFYRERDCGGPSWQFREPATTVPDFLNDHMWSYRNQC